MSLISQSASDYRLARSRPQRRLRVARRLQPGHDQYLAARQQPGKGRIAGNAVHAEQAGRAFVAVH